MSLFSGYKHTDNRITREKRQAFLMAIQSRFNKKRLEACHDYCAFLNKQFTNPLTLKTQYSKARKLLSDNLDQRHHKDKLKTYQSIFTLPEEVMLKIKQDYTQKVVHKNRLQQVITHKEFMANIDKANQLMGKTHASPLQLIISLAIVTGRRFFEIACRARFTLPTETTKYPLSLMFEGQAKTRQDTPHKPFLIPCLVSPDSILNALQRLRELKPELTDLTNERFNNSFSRGINETIKRGDFAGVKQPKDVRNLYLAYCIKYLKPVNISNNAYAAQILGHSDEDIQTANSYMTHVIIE